MIFACPNCRGSLIADGPDSLRCEMDSLRFPKEEGIWCFLMPDQKERFAPFMRDYAHIREQEGRRSDDPDYFRSLPYTGDGGRLPEMWRQRAASFETFQIFVLLPLQQGNRVLKILDLGAGNGWLSNRLSQAGHAVWAVDLLANDWDGLGAHQHYKSRFTPVQAEFDRLPFEGRSFDLLVFNASFHYSTDYGRTLEGSLPLLNPGGTLALLDTPLYRREASGRQMVAERHAAFEKMYGLRSDALPHKNFLTYRRLWQLADNHGLEVAIRHPDPGLRRRIRALWFRLRRGREPAAFPVIRLRRPDAGPEFPR